MRNFLLLVLLIGGVASPAMHATNPTPARVLVLSAPGPDDEAYRDQAALLLPAWAGLIERDFAVETRFGAAKFSVILIGRDGGEKLRRSSPLPPGELFALVDAMPMRRAEMRERPPVKN